MAVRKVSQRIPFEPSRTQAALLEQCFGARRFAYNRQVEAFNTYDKDTNPRPKYPSIADMKAANEWLGDSPVPSNALSNTIMDFRKAKAAYFRKAEYGKNRPRFASKSDNIQSFRNGKPMRRMEGNRFPLSKKLGSVRIRRRDRIRLPTGIVVELDGETRERGVLSGSPVRRRCSAKASGGWSGWYRRGRQRLPHAVYG